MKVKKDILKKISQSLVAETNKRNSAPSNIYLYQEVMPEKAELNIGPEAEVILSRNSVVALVDLDPKLNWGHPCKHILYDAETGEEYNCIESNLPLSEFYTNNASFETVQENVKFDDQHIKVDIKKAQIEGLDIATNSAKGERYAILFSGISDNRHLNDLEFLYRVLIDVYKFKAENIQVLNENGSVHHSSWHRLSNKNWPGNNTPYRIRVNASGTRKELIKAIRNLDRKLKENDLLFIHTNNHGGRLNGESTLCCWPNWDSMTASDFGREISKLPKFSSLVVMMEQCFSGGFMDIVLGRSTANRTYFSAACRADRSSAGGAYFDPFAFDWIAAINGSYPHRCLKGRVDQNCNSRVSVKEAHEYAYKFRFERDTPVAGGTPVKYIGDIMYLDDPEVVIGNRRSKEFHALGCHWVKQMSDHNVVILDSAQEAVKKGYNGCYYCKYGYDTD